MKFNDRLRVLRIQREITQKQLGDMLGVSSVTIRNWESGTKLPSMNAIISLTKVFGTTSDFLLGIRPDNILKGAPASRDEARLISDYRGLDSHGKKLVSTVCSLEKARVVCEETTNNITDINDLPTRYIPKYTTPSAAGYAVPLDNEDYELIPVDETVPQDADFATVAQGDSMEPFIHDGDTVFVKKDCDLDIGDVGIFIVNGSRYCKQYFIDGERNLTLVSANPELRRSNVYISAESDATVICCGKVLLQEATPLPAYFTEA